VRFEDAMAAIVDVDALIEADTAANEDRLQYLGMSRERVLCVVTVERTLRTRIISARHATLPEVRRYQSEPR
jgi:uncharacterized DUF497 family protein